MSQVTRRLRRLTFGVAVAAVAGIGAPAAAFADFPDPGNYAVWNMDGAVVHLTSNTGAYAGPYAGHLNFTETFHTNRVSGNWCIGYAYGHVNHVGNVLCTDLSPWS